MRKLDIQMFWQPNQGRKLKDRIPITKRPISPAGLDRPSTADSAPARRIDAGDEFAKSGHFFTLKTDDPITYPLPGKELL